MQQSIFDIMYPKFKITNKIKIIEFFGGYGSQSLGMKYINANFEHHKLCEWAIKSIQAYKDIHMENDNTDYSKDLSIQDVKDYLSEKMMNCFTKETSGNYPRKERFYQSIKRVNESDIANTITTLEGNRDISTFIRIKNNTKKGYLECYEGDGVDLTQPTSKTRRGRVQKESIQTLTCENNLGVCVKPKVIGGIVEKDSNNNTQWKQQNRVYDGDAAISITTSFNPFYKVNTIGNYSPSNHNAARVVDNEGSAPTVMENHGTITATQDNDLKIRKLTPRECFRLMGVKDEDFDKVRKNQSDSSLYHLAGDSIVVNILCHIYKNMM